MCPPDDFSQLLTLLIKRLMDADVLLPEEGEALLAEVEEIVRSSDVARQRIVSATAQGHFSILEALLTTTSEESAAGEAQAIVHQILKGEANRDRLDSCQHSRKDD